MKGYEKCSETTSQTSCWTKLRQSGFLIEVVVFMALMLDVMLMTTIDPILPAMLKDIEGQESPVASNQQQETTLEHSNDGVTLAQYGLHHRNRKPIIVQNIEDTVYYKVQEPLPAFQINSVTTEIPSSGEFPMQNMSYLELSGKIGVLVAAKPATEIIANLLVGCLVDRVGHRFPMLIGIVFNTAATVGFAYSHNFLLLMITRVLQAIGSSLSVVSGLALLATFYPEDEERSKANSRVFLGISIGIVFGYPYGSTVYQFAGREAPFLILAGITLFDGLLRLIVITPKTSQKSFASENGFCGLLCDGYILLALGCVFTQHFGLGVFLASGPAWMLDTLHAQQWQIGAVLAVAVIFHFMAQIITGWLAVKYGRWKFCLMGMVFFAGGLALYPLCRNIWDVIGPEIAVRLGHGTVLCVISPLLSHLTDIRHSSQYGMVYGLYTAAYNMGLAVGPLAGGFLTTMYPFSWIYWGTAIVIFAYSFLCFFLRNPRPKKSILKSCKDCNGHNYTNGHKYIISDARESLPTI